MKENFVLRKFFLNEVTKDKISKKLSRLGKFFSENTEITITLFNEGKNEVVELTIYENGTFYRAEQSASDILSALDTAIDVIEGQLRKYKTKLEKRLRKDAFDSFELPDDDSEDSFKVTNIKQFIYKPMSCEEAILQMNLLGHQFFVFKDEDTEKICVVYRRKNNEYGLIEPVE